MFFTQVMLLADLPQPRVRGWMMLVLIATVLVITLVVISLIFRSWRRTLARTKAAKTVATSDAPNDAWSEAGRRLDVLDQPDDPSQGVDEA